MIAGAAGAGGTVAGAAGAGGTVAGGTVAGATLAGVTVPGGIVVGGAVTPGVPRAAIGGVVHSDLTSAAGSLTCAPAGNVDGGHAGIVCSVGGSGGQMSLCVGSGASGWAFGGQVSGADRTGSDGGDGSGSPATSAGAGTVCAHEGAGFCIGMAGLGVVSSTAAASDEGDSVD